jgi:hypothetical protein
MTDNKKRMEGIYNSNNICQASHFTSRNIPLAKVSLHHSITMKFHLRNMQVLLYYVMGFIINQYVINGNPLSKLRFIFHMFSLTVKCSI